MRHALIVALVAAVACAPRQAAPPKDFAAAGPPGVKDDARLAELFRARSAPGATDLCLGAGDLLTVNVFGWDAMRDQQVRVSSSGAISLRCSATSAAGRTENGSAPRSSTGAERLHARPARHGLRAALPEPAGLRDGGGRAPVSTA
jgi:hypothetical protein